MKYVILLGDGMSDWPLPELGDKTPLQAAHTPHMDRLARDGKTGQAWTIPEGMSTSAQRRPAGSSIPSMPSWEATPCGFIPASVIAIAWYGAKGSSASN